MKKIRIYTHGQKGKGANPGMTAKGFADIATLRQYLPKKIGQVFTGSGQRHKDVAEALGLTEYISDVAFSNGDSAEVVDGKPFVIRENGDLVPLGEDTWLKDNAAKAVDRVSQLNDNDVICAGRPLGIMLKMAGAIDVTFVDTGVYEITIENGKITGCTEIHALGKIDPILQKGQ